jgi:hypothetical protein
VYILPFTGSPLTVLYGREFSVGPDGGIQAVIASMVNVKIVRNIFNLYFMGVFSIL